MTDDKKTIDDRLTTRNFTPLLRIGSVWVNLIWKDADYVFLNRLSFQFT